MYIHYQKRTILTKSFLLHHTCNLICLLHGGVSAPTDQFIFKNNYGLQWFTRGQVLNIFFTSHQLQQRQLSFLLLAWDKVCRYTCINESVYHLYAGSKVYAISFCGLFFSLFFMFLCFRDNRLKDNLQEKIPQLRFYKPAHSQFASLICYSSQLTVEDMIERLSPQLDNVTTTDDDTTDDDIPSANLSITSVT